MKKLCSGLMAIVLSLSQVCSTCSAEGNAEYNESYSRYLSKSSKKDKEDCKGTDDKQKKINLIISSIFLSAAILGATGIHEYAELKKPNIFKQFYSATFGGIWNLAKDGGSWLVENYPIAKNWISKKFSATQNWTSEKYDALKTVLNSTYYDTKDWTSEKYDALKTVLNSTYYDTKDWTSEKYDALKTVLNSTYYDTKDWTSEKYDAGKVWFNEADASKKVAAGVGLAATFLTVLLVTIVHCCKRADTPVAAFESIPEVYDEFADDMRHWGANLN